MRLYTTVRMYNTIIISKLSILCPNTMAFDTQRVNLASHMHRENRTRITHERVGVRSNSMGLKSW